MSTDATYLSNSSNPSPKDLNSTAFDSRVICTIDPIHSGSQISFLSLKNKLSPQKPAFGTSSSRQIPELKGKKQSDIVAYSTINYQKNQKYNDRFQQIKAKITPFMSTCGRFNRQNGKNPGPGQYSLPQVLKKNSQNKSKQGPMFCPFKRWQSQENKPNIPSKLVQQDLRTAQWKNKQNYQPATEFDLQQRIKAKREEIREKMQNMKEKMRKPKESCKFVLQRMGFSENQDCKASKQLREQPKSKYTEYKISPQKVVNLRQITGKYLPKLHYQFQRQEYRTGVQTKNFKQMYNHQAIFVAKDENLFSSYIPKSENPGPGYYEKQTKKTKKK